MAVKNVDPHKYNTVRGKIGHRIKALRKSRKATQFAVASAIGLSGGGIISQFENGKKGPGIETLYLMADVLLCDISDLLPSLGDF